MKKNLRTAVRKSLPVVCSVFYGLMLQCILFSAAKAEEKLQDIYQVNLSLTMNNAPMKEIFREIENKTEFSFTYSSRKINLTTKLSLDGSEKNLGTILEKIMKVGHVEIKQLNHVLVVRPAATRTVSSNVLGTLTGVVIDSLTDERLPGASIRVMGTNTGTSTDLNGEFMLRLPEGNAVLEITYIGFKTLNKSISVSGNDLARLEIKLSSDVTHLENIVFTGILQGQQRALNQQKSADNIKNVVSADQIGRFPDPNVAEALQRIPAVNIERDQGEGRYVLVRGLAPQFTNVSINGEQIPSPEAGVRYVALDAIPADQLASIEVSKAITPDMDGDAIGGSVNLITRTAQSSTPTVRASALLGYNNITEKSNLQGSLEVGKRFLNEKLGIMLNSSYYETDRGSDNWERDDSEFELRDYQLNRTRMGLSSTFDYKLNSEHEFYFRTIYNRFTDREQRRTYLFVPNADNSPFESNEIERAHKDRLEKQIVSSYNLGGKHNFKAFDLDYEVAYAKGIQDTPFDIEVNTVAEVDDLSTDFLTDPKFPSFQVNGLPHTNRQNVYLDNSIYEFDEFTSGKTYALDENKTAKINVSVPYQLGTSEGLIKFGGKVRLKEKSYSITENVFSWEGGDVDFGGQEGDYTLEKFQEGSADTHYLDNRYFLSPNIDVARVMQHFNQNLSGYQLAVNDKLAAEAVESYKAKEDVYAGYLMSKLQINKLMLLGGVRYELTKVNYSFSEVVYDFEGELEEIIPQTGGTDYSFVLPQLHAKYELDKNTNLRAAITASYSRPNFQDIVPSQEIDYSARQGTVGNAALKPVSATNFDLLAEHYFGTVGILSGGVFYKNLNDFIFRKRFEETRRGTELMLTQAQNGNSANLFGFEVAYQQNLTFLPSFLKGFTVYANYTFTTSNAEIQSRTNDTETEEIRLPGQAKHLGNLSLGYEWKRINVRVSSNFNGEYLSETGGDASEDLYVKSRMQVDATATVTINNRLRFFAEFLNITNQPFEVYMGKKDHYIQREWYSWWTRVGLKFDF